LKITATLYNLNAAHFCELRNAAREPGDNRFFPGAQFGQVNAREIKLDPARFGFSRRSNRMSGVQKSFGRYATTVEANAAQSLVSFDQNDFFAEVGGVKSGGIAAGTGAKHNQISF